MTPDNSTKRFGDVEEVEQVKRYLGIGSKK
jgi:hypothetical protein